MDLKTFKATLFDMQASEFEQRALWLFRYQAENNEVYKEWLRLLNINAAQINRLEEIPYLPISCFKTHALKTPAAIKEAIVFSSSGTTGSSTSRHYVADLSLYEQSFNKGFEYFYGSITDYCVLALLPAYLERKGSSLVYMADHLIRASGHEKSGFYLHDQAALVETLRQLEAVGQQTLLLGVSFALWNLAEDHPMRLQHTMLMETGGMKGRRKELVRSELHQIFCSAFGLPSIHSEFGMTELLSQAYSKGDGIFYCPPWMSVSLREVNDPLSPIIENGKTGGVNIIDLANVHSCAFIATNDLGKTYSDGGFEILGRFDNSDIRGCNLLVQ